MSSRPGVGKAYDPGTYRYPTSGPAKYAVTLGSDGSIRVGSGDWVSKYAACLYGDPQVGWSDFGRKDAATGVLRNLADPNRIASGETLYHIPTFRARKGGAAKVETGTNVWIGLGVDVQYTLGVVGQQLLVFSLRSVDEPKRAAIVFVEGYKFGLSVDLTTNAYIVVATGLRNPHELNGDNFWKKLNFDFTLALGVNAAKAGQGAYNATKAAKAAAPVARQGTRMARKRLTPAMQRVWEKAKKDLDRAADDAKGLKLPRLPGWKEYRELLSKLVRLTPDDYGKLVKAARTAHSTLDINFESPLPEVHCFEVLGGGVGLGIHWSFGEMFVLYTEE